MLHAGNVEKALEEEHGGGRQSSDHTCGENPKP